MSFADSKLQVAAVNQVPYLHASPRAVGWQQPVKDERLGARLRMEDSPHHKHRARLYVLSALVGLVMGLVAAAFHRSVDLLVEWRVHLIDVVREGPLPGWLVLVTFGGVMTGLSALLVRRFAPEAAGSGIQEVEGALEDLRPLRGVRILLVKFVAGLLSMGAGLVLGREGPTVHMGASLGKILGHRSVLNPAEVHGLIAAGAGAGLAAAFNAPLAGIMFVTEEMRRQFNYTFVSFHSVIIASALAVVVNDWWLGLGPSLPITTYPVPPIADLAWFVLLGALVGGVGVLFNRALLEGLELFDAARRRMGLLVPVAVGASIGLILWFLPAAAGDGSGMIKSVLETPRLASALLVLFAIRMVTSISSYASGVPGGIFAPLLALGTLAGLTFGTLLQDYAPGIVTEPGAFAVAAMGALFAATVRAPLTGILLVTELTANHEMTLAMVLTCVSASLAAQALGGQPIYSLLLQRSLRASAASTGNR